MRNIEQNEFVVGLRPISLQPGVPSPDTGRDTTIERCTADRSGRLAQTVEYLAQAMQLA